MLLIDVSSSDVVLVLLSLYFICVIKSDLTEADSKPFTGIRMAIVHIPVNVAFPKRLYKESRQRTILIGAETSILNWFPKSWIL